MTSTSELTQSLRRTFPPGIWRQTHLLLAVSGGADSVALAAAMRELKKGGAGQLRVAHFHHGLRGAEADADEQFVRDLCEQFQLSIDVGRGDVVKRADDDGDGLEAAARAARYDFLRETAEQYGCRYVVTAHTADDQAETILHHILRGTGLAGLAGMPRNRPLSKSVTLVRPLLDVRRADVLAFLENRGLTYREDATNRDTSLTRNRIRRELLPQLAANYNPAVVDALLRLGKLAGEAHAVLDGLADELAASAVTHQGPTVSINVAALVDQPRYLVRLVLQAAWRGAGFPLQGMSYEHWEALAEMLQTDGAHLTPPRDFPGNIHAARIGDQLMLTAPT